MSFWNLNDGSKAESRTDYEMEGGNLEPIPANTGCIAAIEESKWTEYEGDRYIKNKWRVMRPEQYANRVIFQKVKVYGTSRDKDPQATADKAKRMLAAIDANCGGKLAKLDAEPSDMDLMSALVGKPLAIKVMVWKMTSEQTGEPMAGNWIAAVAPAKGKPVEQAPPAPVASLDDDDIPF